MARPTSDGIFSCKSNISYEQICLSQRKGPIKHSIIHTWHSVDILLICLAHIKSFCSCGGLSPPMHLTPRISCKLRGPFRCVHSDDAELQSMQRKYASFLLIDINLKARSVTYPLAAWLTFLTNFLTNLKTLRGVTPPIGTPLVPGVLPSREYPLGALTHYDSGVASLEG